MDGLDDLTELPARGAFLRNLDDAIAAAVTHGAQCCLLLIDLDYLKTVNDHYGHLAGDAALQAAAAVLRANLRLIEAAPQVDQRTASPAPSARRDHLGRYGGDEFVVVLPATDRLSGLRIAERLRAAVRAMPFTPPNDPAPALSLSFSIGVAVFPEDARDGPGLFAAADRALYAAKAAGRDAVRTASTIGMGRPPVPLPAGRLVGRRAELAGLRAHLERAMTGQGGLVLLEGEAGAGKTRLVQELVGLARLLGVRVHSVRWRENGSAERTLGDEDPFALAIDDPAAIPSLLVLDDLHWAAGADLEAFARLATQSPRPPVLLVGTLRPGATAGNPALSRVLAGLEQRGVAADRMVLPPLVAADALALLQQATGLRAPSGARLQEALAAAGGKPALLLEAARRWEGTSTTTPPYDTGPIGDGHTGTPLPSGFLTFLLVEIVESAVLWEGHPHTMAAAQARYQTLLATEIAAHGGVLPPAQGEADRMLAVFRAASGALAAAVALQQAVQSEEWPGGLVLRMRIGIHCGEASPRDGSYAGPTLTRASTLRAAAHGGQIILSQAAVRQVGDTLPPFTSLHSLGAHYLAGLQRASDRAEEVFGVLHPRLLAGFPPLALPRARATNLPEGEPEFVGREGELAAIDASLPRTQLLTLTGAGGSGKTRLAIEAGQALLDRFPDGVWLVELAAVHDPELVAHLVARTVGVRERAGSSPLAALSAYLQGRTMLLILDNCEHLLAACADLADGLLSDCPGLRLVATSREALGASGEVVLPIPTLSLPADTATPEEALRSEAVRLFVVRARLSRPGFTLTGQNSTLVAHICRRLDGIPLAIELAAARLATLSVEAIAARLDDRFRLLAGHHQTGLPRQRTLRATLDWGYALLGDGERVLLRRLSVFVGGWTLEAAEAVCAGPIAGEQMHDDQVLDLLGQLAAKSLLVTGMDGDNRRYHLLESIQQYAAEHLDAAGERPVVEARHRALYLALAEQAEPALIGPDQRRWLERLEREHDNLRTAITSGLQAGDPEHSALRLVGAIWRFWSVRGHIDEGRRLLQAALACNPHAPPALRAKAFSGAGYLALRRVDFAQAIALLEESVALRRQGDDRLGLAESLNNLGIAVWETNELDRAETLHREALAIREALGDRRGIALSLNNLAIVQVKRDQFAAAQPLYEQSHALWREIGDPWGLALTLGNLGNLARHRGEYARMLEYYQERLPLERAVGDRNGVTHTQLNMGIAHAQLGAHDLAGALFAESLAAAQDDDDREMIADALEALAQLAGAHGRPIQAVLLLASASTIRAESRLMLSPWETRHFDASVASLRIVLGQAAFAAAWATGQAAPRSEALARGARLAALLAAGSLLPEETLSPCP